ncbi:MAG: type II toxin-antitoxin system Phd/YefM family antitoxin [Planctomycetaceae bacterium]|nr:type II toxin-antitoxin system Phd/YefM family antitoxin [Planctomycetaceae bacterium]
MQLMATETTYTQARAHLAAFCDQVASTREAVVIRRRGHEDIALVPAAELRSLQETAHLLSSPKNAERLLTALRRARTGKGKPMSVAELEKQLGGDLQKRGVRK